MAAPQRFMVSLADPHLGVLYELAIREKRSLNGQAEWLLERQLNALMDEQPDLATRVARTRPDHHTEVSHGRSAMGTA
jgi:hypothetical protein